MAVYYPSLSSNRESMHNLYPEPHQNEGNLTMYLNQGSSSGSFSEILTGNNRNEMVFIPPTSDLPNLHGQLNGMNGNITGNSISGVEYNFQGQGLSLSLGSQTPSAVPVSSFHYKYSDDETEKNKGLEHSGGLQFGLGDSGHIQSRLEQSGHMQSGLLGHSGNLQSGLAVSLYNNGYQCGTSGLVNNVLHSKYLKPAQLLLDEVVNVRKDLKQSDKTKVQSFHGLSQSKETDGGSSESNGGSSELLPSELHDLQNKKKKLLSMSDEVDKRYNRYYHQMQEVASSFEMVAGLGSAKPYTAVALHRISCHFRCLRDAIRGQIQAICRKLGEQDSLDQQGERIPRLRYLDQRLRQHKALHQQLGMVRPSWRPQRGLPENAVSILRAWLFEHFLHPYPKESEKIVLAKQTGLTKNQVANWFINARVRLWKPMIEEMYKDEFGDSEANSNNSQEDSPKERTDNSLGSEIKGKDSQEPLKSSSDQTNFVFPGQINDPKSDHGLNEQINQASDYGMMDYHRFNLDNSADYRYMGPHQFHDFVV